VRDSTGGRVAVRDELILIEHDFKATPSRSASEESSADRSTGPSSSAFDRFRSLFWRDPDA
jgi:hypothetical protein